MNTLCTDLIYQLCSTCSKEFLQLSTTYRKQAQTFLMLTRKNMNITWNAGELRSQLYWNCFRNSDGITEDMKDAIQEIYFPINRPPPLMKANANPPVVNILNKLRKWNVTYYNVDLYNLRRCYQDYHYALDPHKPLNSEELYMSYRFNALKNAAHVAKMNRIYLSMEF